MATLDDVRRIALALPETTTDDSGMAFFIGGRQFAWPWLERVDSKRARVPNPGVLCVRIADESEKDVLIGMNREVFFTEPHYDGYPAIQVRLAAIDEALLRKLLADAWRTRAPKHLLAGRG
jgi:hypothetical protein